MDARPETRLDLEAFAREAETSVERVERLVEIGALTPIDGAYSDGDVVRSRLLASFEAAGIGLDHVATGIRERAMTLEYVDLFYPHPGPRTGRTFGDLVADLGDRGELLGPAVAAMGLPTPRLDDPTRVADEAVLRTFVEAWSAADPEYTARAARIFGDAVRRAAEAWVALFDEAIAQPLEGRFETVDELAPRLVGPASRINASAHQLILWLLDRHLERTMNALNVDALERELERRGLVPPGPIHPPAIAFVDLAEYTRMTEEHGDESAARAAVRLGELAEVAARAHDGRVIKLLGDGVLLAFERPAEAVAAALELTTSMPTAGLPPAHSGVHAGPVINRDGDVYGGTVNTAARVAGQARAGQVLVTQRVVDEVGTGHDHIVFEAAGESTLKGVEKPVMLYRASQRGG
jgi:adenylate cyclase